MGNWLASELEALGVQYFLLGFMLMEELKNVHLGNTVCKVLN